jgi:hypothetical protein
MIKKETKYIVEEIFKTNDLKKRKDILEYLLFIVISEIEFKS